MREPPDVWIRKAALHALLENYEEAVDCYDRILESSDLESSDLAKVWFLKGQTLIRLARSNNAQYCLDKAMKLGFGSLKKKN